MPGGCYRKKIDGSFSGVHRIVVVRGHKPMLREYRPDDLDTEVAKQFRGSGFAQYFCSSCTGEGRQHCARTLVANGPDALRMDFQCVDCRVQGVFTGGCPNISYPVTTPGAIPEPYAGGDDPIPPWGKTLSILFTKAMAGHPGPVTAVIWGHTQCAWARVLAGTTQEGILGRSQQRDREILLGVAREQGLRVADGVEERAHAFERIIPFYAHRTVSAFCERNFPSIPVRIKAYLFDMKEARLFCLSNPEELDYVDLTADWDRRGMDNIPPSCPKEDAS